MDLLNSLTITGHVFTGKECKTLNSTGRLFLPVFFTQFMEKNLSSKISHTQKCILIKAVSMIYQIEIFSNSRIANNSKFAQAMNVGHSIKNL